MRNIWFRWNCMSLWGGRGEREGVWVRGQRMGLSPEIFMKWKNKTWGGFSESIEILFIFPKGKGFWRALMKKNLKGNRKKRFYGEIWRNAVWGPLGKILWNSPCLTILWKLSLSKGESILRGKIEWDRVVSWSQKCQ